jgi:hypothetical protein
MARVSICWAMTRSRYINYDYTWPVRANPIVVDLARLLDLKHALAVQPGCPELSDTDLGYLGAMMLQS